MSALVKWGGVLLGLLLVIGARSDEQVLAYHHAELLVDVDWVEEQAGKPDIHIIDIRDHDDYQVGHIPGAVHLNKKKLVDKLHSVPGYLIDQMQFEQVMRETGVDNMQKIVVYDDEINLDAARLFYALENYGHHDVHLLNGGYAAWRAAQKQISTLVTEPEEGNFVAQRSAIAVNKQYVNHSIDMDERLILDVRSPDEYSGKDVRTKRGGHIPTAVNLEWSQVLSEEGISFFRPEEEIKALLEQAGITPEKEVIIYCQRANRAAHMYFTLRLMGFHQLRVYEASWEEWGNAPETPIENPNRKKG